MNCDKKDLLLYAVTDRSWLNGRTLYEQVEEALKGGVTFVQLREKNLDDTAFLQEAKEIKELCARYHVPFVINDNVNIAAEIDADVILLAKNVDGVYSADPNLDPNAVKYDTITYDDILAQHLQVMDSTATSLSMDNKIPVVLFALKDPENILRVARGEKIGTIVKD